MLLDGSQNLSVNSARSFFLCSEGWYSSFLASKSSPSFLAPFSALILAKYLSLMLSGTFTPDTSILVVVATKNLWLTLLRGVPFSLNGPVTRRRPVSSCFRTTTRFPLWTPARTMATVPGTREPLTVLLCFEKKLTEVPLGAGSAVG